MCMRAYLFFTDTTMHCTKTSSLFIESNVIYFAPEVRRKRSEIILSDIICVIGIYILGINGLYNN